MLPIPIIKYILYFIILFGIVYVDQRNEIFSMVWKAVLMLIMCIEIFRPVNYIYKSPAFVKSGYIWGIKHFVNFGLTTYAFKTVALGIKFTILPILCEYIDRKFFSKDSIFKLGLLFSQYIVLANIPFLLGILSPAKEAFEYDGEIAYTGIFTGQHPTAIVASMASLFFLYAIFDSKNKWSYRVYNIVLCLINYYVIYTAFTRTGWAMAVIGIVILFFFKKMSIKSFVLTGVLACGLYYGYDKLISTNERFYNRVNDIINDGSYEADTGSGRLVYIATSLNYFQNFDSSTKIIGSGVEPLMDNMMYTIGTRIYSHNGWIDALVGDGIIGLACMTIMVLCMLIYTFRHRKNKYSEITMACIIMYISYQSTQGGVFFYQDVLLAISLALIISDSKIVQNRHIDMFGLKFLEVKKKHKYTNQQSNERIDN